MAEDFATRKRLTRHFMFFCIILASLWPKLLLLLAFITLHNGSVNFTTGIQRPSSSISGQGIEFATVCTDGWSVFRAALTVVVGVAIFALLGVHR